MATTQIQNSRSLTHRLSFGYTFTRPQPVVFNSKTETLDSLLNRNTETTLTAWFELNKRDPEASQYLYSEIPEHYAYNRKLKKWVKRKYKASGVVGRIYSVHTRDIERFSLRLLLNHVRGATCFDDLKTIYDTVYPTFQSAAIELGLLEDATEAVATLEEAYLITQHAESFRIFFSHFIINCTADHGLLWQTFKEKLSEDILYHERLNTQNPELDYNDHVFNIALFHINNHLKNDGYDLRTCPSLPQLTPTQISHFQRYFQVTHNSIFDMNKLKNILDNDLPRLNPEQRLVFDCLISPNSDHGKIFLSTLLKIYT